MNLISVIISTYNWPEALELCLESLLSQSDKRFEIIIADDGSRPDTQWLVEKFVAKSPIPILHLYQEDRGFRVAAIRNKSVAHCNGDYLIFMDGDCVTRSNFIQRHRSLAAVNYFVAGNRALLNEVFTEEILLQNIHLQTKPFSFFVMKWAQKKINRLIPLISLPLGRLRYLQPKKWHRVVSCNMGVWKRDFLTVNGFDETFEGWGYEDSDLAIRLIHSGVMRKEGRFALPVLHLWHPQNDRSNHDQNYQRLMIRLSQPDFVFAKKGFQLILIKHLRGLNFTIPVFIGTFQIIC